MQARDESVPSIDQSLLMSVSLVSINASVAGETPESEPIEVKATVIPSLTRDSQHEATLSVDVTVGFARKGPFEIHAIIEATYRKPETVSGQSLVERFGEVAYVPLAFAGMLVSMITNSMGMVPLSLSVSDLISLSGLREGK
ncbi:MAG: hypothetical protein BWY85_01749 [Firmicutes bacterium ADurb.Bin506]|jgi:hypothetical protein|nr:MAG: hypothetical protein BWY85_01749 [Firmicutes bacterium ADurb.Bin506]